MIQSDKLKPALDALKTLFAEQEKYEALRDKAGQMNHADHSQKRISKANADMHYQAMHVRRCHKSAWAAIVAAGLETTLEKEVANPNGWHEVEL